MNRFALWSDYLRVPASLAVSVAIALAVLLLGMVAYRLVFAVLKRFAGATKTRLDDVLVRRMRLPAGCLVVLLSIHAFVAMRGAQNETLRTAVFVIELLLGAYLVIEAAETIILFYWLGERQKITVPAVVRHLILVVVYTVTALSILGSVAGVNLLPVLATSTVVTVVLGLALQDTLGNLVAGLALHAEKPFGLGDWIQVDGIEGEVVYMGWRSTRLKTFSADIIALPNAVIARHRVQNFYAPDRVSARNIELLVAPSATPERVEKAVLRACSSVEGALANPSPKVWLIGFHPLFHRYVIKVWVDDFRHHDDTESNVMKSVWRACQADGVELPGVLGADKQEALHLGAAAIASD